MSDKSGKINLHNTMVNIDLLLVYKRLLFEIKILRQALEDIIVNEIKNINDTKKSIGQLQELLFIVSNNLQTK